MTSVAKTSYTADTSGLLDATPADAADVLNPIVDVLNHVKSGRMAVSATDTHVKHIDDAFSFGVGLEKALLNPGANEQISLKGRTAIVPFTVLPGLVANIDLTSIPNTFEHLLLVLGIRTANTAATDSLDLRANGDSASANYAALTMAVQHSAALSTNQQLEGTVSAGRMQAAVTGGNAPSGYLGVLYVWLYEYAQTGRTRTAHWYGLVRRGNASGETTLVRGWIQWKNTANAINRLTLLPASGFNIAGGSGYALYGIR